MRKTLILLPIFLLSLIQGALLPLNLVLLLILFWVVFQPRRTSKEIFWLAFDAGLILDLTTGTALGFASLYFLVFTLILIFYGRKFDLSQPLFLSAIVFLGEGFWHFLSEGFFNWKRGLVSALLAFFFRLLTAGFLVKKEMIKI